MPRPQHYEFAHRLLPALVLNQWPLLRPAFQDGSATERLRSMWLNLGERLRVPDRIEPTDLDVRRVPFGQRAAYVVDFPAPSREAEAGIAIIPDDTTPRYFVLELGFQPLTGSPYWVLCEWTAKQHLNLGQCSSDPGISPSNALPDALARIAALAESSTDDVTFADAD